MFRHARIIIGARELNWSLNEPWGEGPVPELYMRELENWPTLHRSRRAGIHARISCARRAGHTPATGLRPRRQRQRRGIHRDAAKNRAELLSRKGDATYDAALSTATDRKIWQLWKKRRGSVLGPGHDCDDAEGRQDRLHRQAPGGAQGVVRRETSR